MFFRVSYKRTNKYHLNMLGAIYTGLGMPYKFFLKEITFFSLQVVLLMFKTRNMVLFIPPGALLFFLATS